MNYLHLFVFGIYPYIALAVFLLGSLVRFEREQYTWRAESSQFLYRGPLRLGSNLFHIGVIGVFLGHLGGLLTPIAVWEFLGVPLTAKQLIAMGAGGVLGGMGLIGLLILLARRLGNERLAAQTALRDKILLPWLLLTLSLGLATIPESAQHLDGQTMLTFMLWAQHILTFRGDAANLVVGAPWVFRLHIFCGLTFFMLFPFTRMVHSWSGFASVTYLTRAWQLVRPR
ncbi:MAG: respiratory nitrate reductase subunit gamma [Paludibacterium sp.]|uniref:respiratory nitrate reductase subunit gamma n=1 Tax=Paludibacterium sp. TaxID=1917523 RepID=UPI0025E8A282|nr:respiratory nitrate reductase subunit gamma [Paludibacterium sp.]MBV8046148.1 respiratory nitrate reductase subunit gamma [Paludibacterium sp.]MBV8648786.1 respiratory nitrate reductase subunit gamma [Paludibacterium sp.]